jgi:hypothetical protein
MIHKWLERQAPYRGTKDMTRSLFSACALAALFVPSVASGTPYENAAKLDMEHFASSILAASVCSGVRFNGDTLVTSLAAAVVLLGQKRAEDAFFSAIRADIDGMSNTGKAAWCTATIKAAREQNWEMLADDNNVDTK